MAIDFNKLNDPEWRAEQKRQREEDERKIEAETNALKAQVEKCMDNYDRLTAKEQSFVRSCRTRLNTWLTLTDPQKKWLADLAKGFN